MDKNIGLSVSFKKKLGGGIVGFIGEKLRVKGVQIFNLIF
jgi:hypothetical protein